MTIAAHGFSIDFPDGWRWTEPGSAAFFRRGREPLPGTVAPLLDASGPGEHAFLTVVAIPKEEIGGSGIALWGAVEHIPRFIRRHGRSDYYDEEGWSRLEQGHGTGAVELDFEIGDRSDAGGGRALLALAPRSNRFVLAIGWAEPNDLWIQNGTSVVEALASIRFER